MKKIILTIALACASTIIFAADTKSENGSSKPAETEYTKVIDERSQKIVDALGLNNADTAKKVHDIIMAQYRALNDWHNTNDPLLKAAKGNKE